MIQLEDWGWDADLADRIPSDTRADLVVARVLEEQRDGYRLLTQAGPRRGRAAGRVRHETAAVESLPAVGDWVLVDASDADHAIIHAVLPRRTKLVRQSAGRDATAQVIAANIDTIFLMTSLNQDLELRRVERYLAAIWESGAQPVLLLSKADLCADPEAIADAVSAVALGVPLHVVSVLRGEGLPRVRAYLEPGRTIALVGSSGVGKSTLLNSLAGEDLQVVRTIRSSDDRGCHTTTARRLVRLSGGGLLLDTPGMRELGLWEAEDGLADAFEDIVAHASRCRFRDCGHGDEPGCAVQAAIAQGVLDPARMDAWQKLGRELAFIRRKASQRAVLAEKTRNKHLTRTHRRAAQERRRLRGQ